MPKTVLIVEDNELNMKLFHDLLEAHGYTTVATRNGIEALDLARKHRPDLILMDIQLPEVSGLEVTKWLKDDEDLRVIPVVTGHRARSAVHVGHHHVEQDEIALGAFAYRERILAAHRGDNIEILSRQPRF